MELIKMSKPQVKEYNCETGEEIIRDANAEEIAQMEIDLQKLTSEQAEAETKAQAKAALLTQLGITEEQAKLLLS
jgi:hypothetical protein